MQPAPYALLPRMDAVTRPMIFPDLAALADHIERARCGQGFDLEAVEDLHHQWRATGGGAGVDQPDAPDRGVKVWTTFLDNGNHDRCLGFVWLNGGGVEELRHALQRAGVRAGERAQAGRRDGLSESADGSPLRTRKAYDRLRDAGWPGGRESYVRPSRALGAG